MVKIRREILLHPAHHIAGRRIDTAAAHCRQRIVTGAGALFRDHQAFALIGGRGEGGVFHPQRTGDFFFKQLRIRLTRGRSQRIGQQVKRQVGIRCL
ncbi:hypothetical protein SDC9_186985 [bioreactor metagenome]|uniref:Uncharacterized protein n=1 Tax=bioreactor metagenome TaxID=1076179 RepID=A0A645HKD9_9ZZZZ